MGTEYVGEVCTLDAETIRSRCIASFEVNGQKCCIVSADSASEDRPCSPPEATGCCSVVGDFVCAHHRFYIVALQESATPADAAVITVVDILTKREIQIAMLVAKGRLNKQIAYQLNLSEFTVSTHLRRIYAKLGVNTRAAMVARLFEKPL